MSNFKKLVEARMQKTGESYSTASRHVKNQVIAPVTVSPERAATPDPIADLIARFRAFHVSSILVGRIPAVAAGHDLAELSRQVSDLADHPKHYGKSAFVESTIKFEEMQALIARGATEKYGVQRIDVFRTERGTTFSVPCANCKRWIYCGHKEHTGKCKCGQAYEITFDAEPDWNLPQGWLCMHCGDPFEMTLVGHPRNPWHPINERQQMCNICFHMSHVGPWWVQKRADERRKGESATSV